MPEIIEEENQEEIVNEPIPVWENPKGLKVGDLVQFRYSKNTKLKVGEIVVLYSDGKADVYVMAEAKVYNTQSIKLKKI